MRTLKSLLILALLLLAGIFALQNAATVDLKFLTWSFTLSRALLVVLLLGAGFILGLLAVSLARRRRAR